MGSVRIYEREIGCFTTFFCKAEVLCILRQNRDMDSKAIFNFKGFNATIPYESYRLFKLALFLFFAFQFSTFYINYDWLLAPNSGLLGECWLSQLALKDTVLGSIDSYWLLVLPGLLLFWFLDIYPAFFCFSSIVLVTLFFARYPILYLGWEQISVCLLSCSFVVEITKRTYNNEYEIPVLSSYLMFTQIGMIYTFNALSKSGPLWMSGNAIAYATSALILRTDNANWLQQQHTLTTLLTYAVLIWEWMVLPMFILSFKYEKLRFPTALSIVLFHFTLSLFIDVGNFKWVSIAMLMLSIPSFFWKEKKLPSLYTQWQWGFTLRPIFSSIISVTLIAILFVSHLTQQYAYEKSATWTLRDVFPFNIPNSFCSQFWHLYSPNPPAENGFVVTELILHNKDTVMVRNGLPTSPTQFKNTTEKLLYTYMTIRNQRKYALCLQSCMVQREIALAKKMGSPPIIAGVAVLYSTLGEKGNTLTRKEIVRVNLNAH